MKKQNYFKLAAVAVAMAIFTLGCTKATEDASKTTDVSAMELPKPNMDSLKAEIQALENTWAAADNARDANAVAAMYADDAISMGNNKPAISGKAAILKDLQESLAKRPKGATIAFETLDVYGDDNLITEVGKTTVKDATGKVTYTGKYMALWEKHDGKWLTIRDMSNDDVKEK
jgi:uncharacterized protein (TIGR02246 family)